MKKIFFLNCESVKHGGVRLETKFLKWEALFGRGRLAILEKELILCTGLAESRYPEQVSNNADSYIRQNVPGHSFLFQVQEGLNPCIAHSFIY